jgi:ApaG protein
LTTQITNGIRVSVETFYQDDYSRPMESKFIFAYKITLENTGIETVQLMRRHWYIHDSNGTVREVEGEGIIGQQPILSPGDAHSYVSWSHLLTEIGKMRGFYTFIRQIDSETFKVEIPPFMLVVPQKLN